MKVLNQRDGTYKIESSSRKGKFYIVDLGKGTCTCPHFVLRLKRVHGMCKHMGAVKDKSEKRDVKGYGKVIDYVQKKGQVESLELIKKFGEEAVDDLIRRGELAEKEGRIRVLE